MKQCGLTFEKLTRGPEKVLLALNFLPDKLVAIHGLGTRNCPFWETSVQASGGRS